MKLVHSGRNGRQNSNSASSASPSAGQVSHLALGTCLSLLGPRNWDASTLRGHLNPTVMWKRWVEFAWKSQLSHSPQTREHQDAACWASDVPRRNERMLLLSSSMTKHDLHLTKISHSAEWWHRRTQLLHSASREPWHHWSIHPTDNRDTDGANLSTCAHPAQSGQVDATTHGCDPAVEMMHSVVVEDYMSLTHYVTTCSGFMFSSAGWTFI